MPLSCSWIPWPIETVWGPLSWLKKRRLHVLVRISSNKLSPWSNQEWKRIKNYFVTLSLSFLPSANLHFGNSALNISNWWLLHTQTSLCTNIHRVTAYQRSRLHRTFTVIRFFLATKDFNSAIHRTYFKFLKIIAISHLP